DVDSHNGGVWKMASSIKDLANRKTRDGIYDINLNRVRD
ncbi:toxin C-terminal domain-containing protein, partial [Terrisporobacter muris]